LNITKLLSHLAIQAPDHRVCAVRVEHLSRNHWHFIYDDVPFVIRILEITLNPTGESIVDKAVNGNPQIPDGIVHNG